MSKIILYFLLLYKYGKAYTVKCITFSHSIAFFFFISYTIFVQYLSPDIWQKKHNLRQDFFLS